ncbi:MAG TPA: carboxymuconolactone decarboxylase family protein [Burkholderiales bacterium]|nr:carboxymuconolactone decarboxylase family protein [Burkholderiales bacterium]
MERFPRLSEAAMTPAQREAAAEISAGPRGEVRGPFLALIHNAGLARRVQALGEHLRFRSKLPPRLLELAVLVTARRWSCQFEWFMHEKLARKAGLDERIIEAISRAQMPKDLGKEESLVHAFCLQAHTTGRVDDATFAAAKDLFGLDGVLELLALNGYYSMMAMVLNSSGIPLPEGAKAPLAPL